MNGKELLRHRRGKLREEIEDYLSTILMMAQPGAVGGEVPPRPWILGLLGDIREYGLWEEGGLADQPYFLMQDLKLAASMEASFQLPGK